MTAALLAATFAWAMPTPAGAAERGYYSQPALNGDLLVFVSEGDLWTLTVNDAARSGQPAIAHRLTSSDGAETMPIISPDGQWLAFTGQYDGNTDVYVMPASGGPPRRLTFHAGADETLGWLPDSSQIVFRSARNHPLGRTELFRISVGGGDPRAYDFGDCSMAMFSATGKRLAFTPYSNERWTWKRYRGGTAPDIWVGETDAGIYRNLTNNDASDLSPMWMLGRVYFASDRSGTMNIYSDVANGGDLTQHTQFAGDDAAPTNIAGYDVRWPAGDSQRRGATIVFCQGGELALLDARSNAITRLDVQLASDRVAARQRFGPVAAHATEFALSPDGEHIVVGSRGEVIVASIDDAPARQLTTTSNAREYGLGWFGDDQLLLISDIPGEPQIALLAVDGPGLPAAVTTDNTDWLFGPVGSPDGQWIVFGNNTLRLNRINMGTLEIEQIDRSDAAEINDYRISPDSQWVAYAKPMPNGFSQIMLHSLRTTRNFAVSTGMSIDGEPRWDPNGKYLYFLSERDHNPMMGAYDTEHVYINTTRVVVVPLRADTPPPFADAARAVEFDLKAWAMPKPAGEIAPGIPEGVEFGMLPDDGGPRFQDAVNMRVDTDGIAQRQYVVESITPGTYHNLEAVYGGVTLLASQPEGLLADDFGAAGTLGPGQSKLMQYSFVDDKLAQRASDVQHHVISADRSTIAWPIAGGFSVMTLADQQVKKVDLSSEQMRINIRDEWAQIFAEAWRLQRDFYWAPNMVGVDWPAMKDKYAAVLPRIGTRYELNDLIGQMIGELGTSHTYIWGGEAFHKPTPVSVGSLAADLQPIAGGYRITRILPSQPWNAPLISPLAQPHLGVTAGDIITAIDDRPLGGATNLQDMLQGKVGSVVRLNITDGNGQNMRTVQVQPIDSDTKLRYLDWVETNRQYVEQRSDGNLGYIHIPNMGGDGLAMFSRQFYPQADKRAIIIDIRNNGGGFVSQMVIERLARHTLAFDQPRHGSTERYPSRGLMAHLCCVIDQHAGSDGDVFPAAFRMMNLGPLIGSRTWGGVVGIRGDKPFVDAGLSTQPEFAWWDAAGWSIENRGVSPDIDVPLTPEDRAAGRDPQLDRAISYLLEKLETDPIVIPAVPPYPVR